MIFERAQLHDKRVYAVLFIVYDKLSHDDGVVARLAGYVMI
jgi:hypothetical protein